MPLPTRPLPSLGALLILVLAAGCEEPAPSGVQPAGSVVAQAVGAPATPAPQVVSTPDRPIATTAVATPPPPKPVPTVVRTPAPISPADAPSAGASGSPSPGTSADPNASPTPTPVASASAVPGSLRDTKAVGDLAISGDGYFLLATRPDPTGTEDLLFTRHGHFVLQAEASETLPLFRLRHADHGFYVLGFQRGAVAGAPAETKGTGGAQLTTTWDGQAVQAAGLTVDGDRNPEAPKKLSFDFAGRLLQAGAAPRGTDGAALASYVAIATVADKAKLLAAPGFPGIYRHAAGAGDVAIGVAVSGAGRTVGNASLILTGKLENL